MEREKEPFEAAMKRLETIVQEMEGGALPIEEALARFEEGMRLSRKLSARLDEVERKVTMLVREVDGGAREEEFSAQARDSGQKDE